MRWIRLTLQECSIASQPYTCNDFGEVSRYGSRAYTQEAFQRCWHREIKVNQAKLDAAAA